MQNQNFAKALLIAPNPSSQSRCGIGKKLGLFRKGQTKWAVDCFSHSKKNE